MQNETLSPVVIFVHSRLDHTKKTIQSLSECYLSDLTDLIVYSDGARNSKEEEGVDSVREYLRSLSGFKSVEVIERDQNFGLANNIISGVSEVLSTSNTVIVLEDDMILSRSFLKYMNCNLNRFSKDKTIWQISSWIPRVDLENDISSSTNLYISRSQLMPCWGWATWKDRWSLLELDISTLMKKFRLKDKFLFNLGMQYPFYSHLVGNLTKRNSTWAIYWYASCFLSDGKSIIPAKPLVMNIGSDGSGSHRPIKIRQKEVLNNFDDILFLDDANSKKLSKLIRKSYGSGLPILQRFSMYLKVLLPFSFWVSFY